MNNKESDRNYQLLVKYSWRAYFIVTVAFVLAIAGNVFIHSKVEMAQPIGAIGMIMLTLAGLVLLALTLALLSMLYHKNYFVIDSMNGVVTASPIRQKISIADITSIEKIQAKTWQGYTYYFFSKWAVKTRTKRWPYIIDAFMADDTIHVAFNRLESYTLQVASQE